MKGGTAEFSQLSDQLRTEILDALNIEDFEQERILANRCKQSFKTCFKYIALGTPQSKILESFLQECKYYHRKYPNIRLKLILAALGGDDREVDNVIDEEVKIILYSLMLANGHPLPLMTDTETIKKIQARAYVIMAGNMQMHNDFIRLIEYGVKGFDAEENQAFMVPFRPDHALIKEAWICASSRGYMFARNEIDAKSACRALEEAVLNDSQEGIDALLYAYDFPDEVLCKVLLLAAENGYIEPVKFVLALDEDVFSYDDKFQGMRTALRYGHVAIFDLLHASWAKTFHETCDMLRDDYSEEEADDYYNKYLLTSIKYVDPFFEDAVTSGDLRVINHLNDNDFIDHERDANVILDLAIKYRQLDIVRWLMTEKKCKVSDDLLLKHFVGKNRDILQIIINFHSYKIFETPFLAAILYNDINAIRQIDISHESEENKTKFMEAAFMVNNESVKRAVSTQIAVSQPSDQTAALLFAFKNSGEQGNRVEPEVNDAMELEHSPRSTVFGNFM